MFDLRDVVIFLLGAQTFHTLAHIFLPMFIKLPFEAACFKFSFTRRFNVFAIIINLIITALLFAWVNHLSHFLIRVGG